LQTVRKIGILGGTFDPIHNGHIALARAASDQLALSRLYLVPAQIHPLASKRTTEASSGDRLEMVMCAAGDRTNWSVSDFEMTHGDVSYTVETLRYFRSQHPKPAELFFITGGDWGKRLDEWKDIKGIFDLAHFVVAKRPGFDISKVTHPVERLDFVPLDISSTVIRKRLALGEPVAEMVPEAVLHYIRTHHLYGA
jgi:nicotinate-nucleotide adenylyltransferase